MDLSSVESFEQIQRGIEEFCSQAFTDRSLAKSLVRQTTYWVYDPVAGNFGPGKFVGFANISYDAYRKAREVDPPEFDGGRTRRAIEKATGLIFIHDHGCVEGLAPWVEELLGHRALDGIAPEKWRFLRLPASEDLPGEFLPALALPPLLKNIGKSQHQDGVRINLRFHDLFNPPGSPVHVTRGSRRDISVFFNGQVFAAHYVYEGTRDMQRTMQRIQFGNALKKEFKKVFPDQRGQFTIQAGADLNHFLFRVPAASQQKFSEDLSRRIEQSRQDSREDRQARLRDASKKPATVQVTSTAYVRNPDVIAEVLLKADGRCEGCFSDAPFLRAKDGTPYLEVHHSIPLAEGGEDTVDNAVALCPNCHRKAHFG